MPAKEFRQCLPPFQDRYSSGPFFDKKNNRSLIHLLKKGSPARTLSYPRYLYSVKEGEEPSPGYDVDHIDGNRRNDCIANLQLLSRKANLEKAHKDPLGVSLQKQYRLVCPKCGVEFFRKKSNTTAGRDQKVPVTFCSTRCRASWRDFLEATQEIQEIHPPNISTIRYMEPWVDYSSPLAKEEQHRRALKSLRAEIGGFPKICPECKQDFVTSLEKQIYCGNVCSGKVTGRNLSRFSQEDAEAVMSKVIKGECSWTTAGKSLGVSNNAVRKWALRNGYEIPTRKYTKVPEAGIEPATSIL